MSNFGYDKNLKAGADIISRMSMVGRSADKASALLAGLGKRMDSVGKTSERLGGIGGKLDLRRRRHVEFQLAHPQRRYDFADVAS